VVARRGRKIPRSFVTRATYACILVALVVGVGTVGIHLLEGLSYLDSFYFTAMLATGEGPNFTPASAGGKVFVGLMAFVSVGTVITSLLFLFGPFLGSVFRSGLERIEEEAEKEKERIEKSS
jgi:hypothetical protein